MKNSKIALKIRQKIFHSKNDTLDIKSFLVRSFKVKFNVTL